MMDYKLYSEINSFLLKFFVKCFIIATESKLGYLYEMKTKACFPKFQHIYVK